MGIFYKTIQDVKRAIEKGDFETAKNILTRHIDDEHNMESNFSKITRDLHQYQILLSNLKETCTSQNKDIPIKRKEELCLEDLEHLNQTRAVLIASMKYLMTELKRE